MAGLVSEHDALRAAAEAERYDQLGDRGERAHWFAGITEMPLGLVAGDVRVLAAVAEPGAGRAGYLPFKFVVRMVRAPLAEGAVGAETLADAVADQVLGWNAMVYHWYGADEILRSGEQHLREWDPRTQVAELRDKALELAWPGEAKFAASSRN